LQEHCVQDRSQVSYGWQAQKGESAMFDPENIEAILKLDDRDLGSWLPNAEDDRHEYKSGSTKDSELATKIALAASGFWNSGGGLFVAGVDGSGQPDGGIGLMVGRQSRRDWIDQIISQVAPRARYVIQCVEDHGTGANILSGNAVVLIGFAPSEVGPHMAPDNRYYVRAGAHTVRANHFLIESIWSRRHAAKPRIVHVTDFEQWTTESGFLIIELVAITSTPALDVVIELSPQPSDGSLEFPVRTTLVDRSHAFTFRFEVPASGFKGRLSVGYRDQMGTQYTYDAQLDSKACIPNWHRGQNQLDEICRALSEINRTLQRRHY
jgi:hypothetical protein